jgi:hypothetical protein
VFELLKRHLRLEVSARSKIDLGDYILGSQNRYYQDIPVAVSGDVVSHVYRSHLGDLGWLGWAGKKRPECA